MASTPSQPRRKAGHLPAERVGRQCDRTDAGIEARHVAAAGQEADAHPAAQPADAKRTRSVAALAGTSTSALLNVALWPGCSSDTGGDIDQL
jgi:hypothetical protein